MARGVVTPIEGEDYREVPTVRHPQLLRRQARARVTGNRREPRGGWVQPGCCPGVWNGHQVFRPMSRGVA